MICSFSHYHITALVYVYPQGMWLAATDLPVDGGPTAT